MIKIVQNRRIQISLTLLFLFLFSSCNKNKHHVDLSGVQVSLEFSRFDQASFAAQTPEQMATVHQDFPMFTEVYFKNIIGDIVGVGTLAEQNRNFIQFVQHPDIQGMYKVVQEKYNNVQDLNQEITEAFKYFKYHFPQKTIPNVVYFVSPFRLAHPVMDSAIGISLDMYLGANYEPYYYDMFQLPQYMIKKFEKRFIVPNTLSAWISTSFEQEKDGRLLDNMIFEGKLLYLMDAVLPDYPDSLKIGYTQGQIEWNEKNLQQIWGTLIEEEWLYSQNESQYMRLLTDGPFTSLKGFPQESSPKLGIWVGWQIVRAYMENNTEVSLPDLMAKDPEEIFRQSKFKP